MAKKVLTPEDIIDLEKGLSQLGFDSDEVAEYIQKAKSATEEDEPSGDDNDEGTIAEKTKGEGDEPEEEPEAETEDPKEDPKEAMRKEYEGINKRKAEIEKALGIESEDIKKSIDSPGSEDDIMKAFGARMEERLDDIQKAIFDQVEERVAGIRGEYDDIIKGIQEDVRKIGDQPIGLKSAFTKANFFQKSVSGDDENEPTGREMSISKDRDDLIKAMEDEFNATEDKGTKEMLEAAISDYTINKRPTSHGSKGLVYVSKRQNITLNP